MTNQEKEKIEKSWGGGENRWLGIGKKERGEKKQNNRKHIVGIRKRMREEIL